jgi:hypothetical protein
MFPSPPQEVKRKYTPAISVPTLTAKCIRPNPEFAEIHLVTTEMHHPSPAHTNIRSNPISSHHPMS